jgi:predicted RNase H-like HicB family nuclease
MSGTIFVRTAPDGTFAASVAELRGCFARGRTREEAISNARANFRDLLAILERRGVSIDHWKGLDPTAFVVREAADPTFIDDDTAAPDEHELRDFLHQREALRSALQGVLHEVTASDIERQPSETVWSVRQALEHVMTTEVSLLSRLERWPVDEFGTLQSVHRLVSQRFAAMEPSDHVDHEVRGQRWTTRKVMRRLLEHEYEHLGHIKEILAALGAARPPA